MILALGHFSYISRFPHGRGWQSNRRFSDVYRVAFVVADFWLGTQSAWASWRCLLQAKRRQTPHGKYPKTTWYLLHLPCSHNFLLCSIYMLQFSHKNVLSRISQLSQLGELATIALALRGFPRLLTSQRTMDRKCRLISINSTFLQRPAAFCNCFELCLHY